DPALRAYPTRRSSDLRRIDLRGDGTLNIEIQESILSLDEVVVSSGALSNVNKLEMGVQSLSIAEVRRLPSVMGEVDVLRGILTRSEEHTSELQSRANL